MLKIATKFSPLTEEPFRRAVDAGFHFAELWTGDTVLADVPGVLERAASFPLQYVIHFPNSLSLSESQLREFVRLYRGLNCNCSVIHQAQIDRYAADLRRLDADLVLGVENHLLSVDDLQTWGRENPGLTLDVEHVWKFTLDDAPYARMMELVEKLLREFVHKLRHVHLPGYVAGYEEHRPMYCSREMVFAVLTLLDELGYHGFVTSEVDMAYQTANDLRMDVLLVELWQRQNASQK